MEKFIPEIGTKLYMYTPCNDMWVSDVRKPYTVVGYAGGKVLVQACKLIFNGPRYYDTLPDRIEENPNGEVVALSWAGKKHRWQYNKYHDNCPEVAVFGEWDYQPYLN